MCQPCQNHQPMSNGQQFGSFSGIFQLFWISEWISEWPFWYSILIFNLKNHNLILGLEWPRNVPTMSKSPTNVKYEAIWVIFRHFFNFSEYQNEYQNGHSDRVMLKQGVLGVERWPNKIRCLDSGRHQVGAALTLVWYAWMVYFGVDYLILIYF